MKTVSAFSNYDGGTIVFGIDDDGKIKGLADAKQSCLDIENKIKKYRIYNQALWFDDKFFIKKGTKMPLKQRWTNYDCFAK